MDTTSSNKGKGVMNAISGNPADNGFRVFDGESLNQAPSPINMPCNQCNMVHPNPSFYGEPLNVAPLTVANPGEIVGHTPTSIINHKAYNGGWKVLLHRRPDGRVDKKYIHKDFGPLRSKVAVLSKLEELLKKSADHDNKGSGDNNKSAVGNNDASGSHSAEGKNAAAINLPAEGKNAA